MVEVNKISQIAPGLAGSGHDGMESHGRLLRMLINLTMTELMWRNVHCRNVRMQDRQ